MDFNHRGRRFGNRRYEGAGETPASLACQRQAFRQLGAYFAGETPASLACQRQAFRQLVAYFAGETPASLACQRQAFRRQAFQL